MDRDLLLAEAVRDAVTKAAFGDRVTSTIDLPSLLARFRAEHPEGGETKELESDVAFLLQTSPRMASARHARAEAAERLLAALARPSPHPSGDLTDTALAVAGAAWALAAPDRQCDAAALVEMVKRVLADRDTAHPGEVRMAPVQAERGVPFPTRIPWHFHERAWSQYAAAGHGQQSAERMAERGGFGVSELVVCLLGRNYNASASYASLTPADIAKVRDEIEAWSARPSPHPAVPVERVREMLEDAWLHAVADYGVVKDHASAEHMNRTIDRVLASRILGRSTVGLPVVVEPTTCGACRHHDFDAHGSFCSHYLSPRPCGVQADAAPPSWCPLRGDRR